MLAQKVSLTCVDWLNIRFNLSKISNRLNHKQLRSLTEQFSYYIGNLTLL